MKVTGFTIGGFLLLFLGVGLAVAAVIAIASAVGLAAAKKAIDKPEAKSDEQWLEESEQKFGTVASLFRKGNDWFVRIKNSDGTSSDREVSGGAEGMKLYNQLNTAS